MKLVCSPIKYGLTYLRKGFLNRKCRETKAFFASGPEFWLYCEGGTASMELVGVSFGTGLREARAGVIIHIVPRCVRLSPSVCRT